METPFVMSWGVEKLRIRWWLNRLTNVFLHFSVGFFMYLLWFPVLNNDWAHFNVNTKFQPLGITKLAKITHFNQNSYESSLKLWHQNYFLQFKSYRFLSKKSVFLFHRGTWRTWNAVIKLVSKIFRFKKILVRKFMFWPIVVNATFLSKF